MRRPLTRKQQEAQYDELKARVTALRLDVIECWDNDGVVSDVPKFQRAKSALDKAEHDLAILKMKVFFSSTFARTR